MKILLVSTSFEVEWRSTTIKENSHYPLGIAYIHAYLERDGHTVESLFLNDYPYDDCYAIVQNKVDEFAPDVVGFNIMTNNRTSSFVAIEFIHEKYPDIRIVAGGVHSSVMYEQMVKKYPFMVAIIGEGEVTAGELMDSFAGKMSLDDVAGIGFIRDGEFIKTKERPLIEDLDTLPFPRHEAFFTEKRTTASLLTSRGCPFKCTFCVLAMVSQRAVRMRSVGNVVAEIQHLVASYPQLETVWLHDDQFFIDNKRVIELCEQIVANNIKLRFVCSGRFKPISREMVSAMERAGFVQALMGLESGSAKVLKLAKKGVKPHHALEAVSLFKDSKIVVTCFLIVGLYGENDSTVEETINLVREMQKIKYLVYHDIGVLTIYPGIEIYDIAKKAGAIDNDYWLTDKKTPFFTVEHTEEQLLAYKNRILDHIAITRFFTVKGFKAQFSMLPYILKFGIKNISIVPMVAMIFLQKFAPNLYMRLKRIFSMFHSKNGEIRIKSPQLITSATNELVGEIVINPANRQDKIGSNRKVITIQAQR